MTRQAAQIPAEWVESIQKWARGFPRIEAVHLFGSRAKGKHRPDSDLDLAVTLADDPAEEAFVFALCETEALRESLAPLLPVPVDLQFALPGDSIVTPAVQREGIELYRAGQRCPPQ